MARLIAVSIECRNETARHTFEELVSRRRDYLVTKGQGTGAVDMLLLELDEIRPQQTFADIRSLLRTSPDLEVFLTASRTDPQVLLEAFRLGVKEFLPQPLTRQDVEAALKRFEERFNGRQSGAESQSGRVVSIIGGRGGVGTSTVVTNLAVAMQQAKKRESVAVMDLDIQGGDLGLFFDVHPSQGLQHLSTDISRLDRTILHSVLVSHRSGLSLLASGYEGLGDARLHAGSTMRVIGLLRSMYQHVLVDCGHMVETAAKEALECSDQIVIVLTLSLPAIRRSKRLLDGLCARQLPPGRIVVLVNRYTKDQKELLEETQEILGLAISGAIPNDYDTAHDAINQGNPLALMAPKTCLAQWFLRSHTLIDGSPGVHDTTTTGKEEKSASFLGRYLASFRHEARERPSQI